jgi:hypothetical protein
MATDKTEKAEIKRFGGTPVKNSGRGVHKGDAVLEPFLVDVKEYTDSFSVSRKVWAKISTDSIKNGRRQPALMLALGEENELPVRVWVIGDAMFKDMLDAWRQVNAQD